jgi:predicted ATPase/class 3 adenylate cyclase
VQAYRVERHEHRLPRFGDLPQLAPATPSNEPDLDFAGRAVVFVSTEVHRRLTAPWLTETVRGDEFDGAGDRSLPVGDVTFLFTDVEGSTRLWEDDPDAMEHALAAHDERLRSAMERHHGYVFTTAGDSFAVAFDDALDAVAAAVEAQRALIAPCGSLNVRVRMGIHSGVAAVRDGDYFGSVVNRCARLMSAGHGGQILVSSTTRALIGPAHDPRAELVDLGLHRLKDLREPENIFELRHPDLPSDFPPLRTLREARSNIPIQLTDFVGRATEISEIHRLLDEHRLITLTGPGGSGKTRLALHAAAESLDEYPGGTFLVELAGITDAQLVADEVAECVGAKAVPDTAQSAAIATRIGDQRMLLVLDNCEHMIEPATRLMHELLRACPELRVLATSQHALDIAGEVRYRVPSLALPDPTRPDEAIRSDSVQLFGTRAAAVRPDFVVDAENLGDVVSICRRLDGIPLALELAAARIGVLSPAQINARLGERFRLLGGSGRGVAPRHQTLRATMDWSHTLLTDTERAVFRRLSVFAGDFTVEAAEAVAAGDTVDVLDVLDVLTSLADKSLVNPEHAPGETRYRLQESVRAYGLEQLELAGETSVAHQRHAAHYLDVAEALYVWRRTGKIGEALDGWRRDEANLRMALRSTLDAGEFESTARIIGGIGHLWYLAGAFREGIEWCRELFDADPTLDDEMLARPLHVYGTLLGSWQQPEAGAEMLRREADLLRGLDEPMRLASALNNLGNLLNDMGRVDEAEASLTEAIEQFGRAGTSAALAYVSLAFGYFQTGRYDEALEVYSRGRRAGVDDGNEYVIALADASISQVEVVRGGDREQARARLGESRERFSALGVQPGVALCDMILGHLEREAGDLRAAASHLRDALDEPDAHWYLASKYWIVQLVAGMVDDPTLADRLLAVAEDYDAASSVPQPVWVRDDLARTRERLGSPDRDRRLRTRPSDPDAAVELARAVLDSLADPRS